MEKEKNLLSLLFVIVLIVLAQLSISLDVVTSENGKHFLYLVEIFGALFLGIMMISLIGEQVSEDKRKEKEKIHDHFQNKVEKEKCEKYYGWFQQEWFRDFSIYTTKGEKRYKEVLFKAMQKDGEEPFMIQVYVQDGNTLETGRKIPYVLYIKENCVLYIEEGEEG